MPFWLLLVANGHLTNFLCVAAAGLFIIGAQHVLNNFTASSYPTEMRASGVGMMLGTGRVGAILGPFVAGWLQGATGNANAMFWTIGLCGLLAGVAIGSLGLEVSTSRRPRTRPAHLTKTPGGPSGKPPAQPLTMPNRILLHEDDMIEPRHARTTKRVFVPSPLEPWDRRRDSDFDRFSLIRSNLASRPFNLRAG